MENHQRCGDGRFAKSGPLHHDQSRGIQLTEETTPLVTHQVLEACVEHQCISCYLILHKIIRVVGVMPNIRGLAAAMIIASVKAQTRQNTCFPRMFLIVPFNFEFLRLYIK